MARNIAILTLCAALILAAAGCPKRLPTPEQAKPGEQSTLLAVGWSAGPIVDVDRALVHSGRGVLLIGEQGTWVEHPLQYQSPSWALYNARRIGERTLVLGFDEQAAQPLAWWYDAGRIERIKTAQCSDAFLSDCDQGPDGVLRCVGWSAERNPVTAEIKTGVLTCEPQPALELPTLLHRVECYGQERALAVGEYVVGPGPGSRGLLYSLDQGSWSAINPVGVASSWSLYAADLAEDGSGYLVGVDHERTQGLLMRWNGHALTRIDLPRYAQSWSINDLDCDDAGRCLLAASLFPGEGLLLLWRGDDVIELSALHPNRLHRFERIQRLSGGGLALCGSGVSDGFGFVMLQQAGTQRLVEFPELGASGGYAISAICELPPATQAP
ncbi:MAG: hypothetical protein P9M14_07655 [Candidatus Alcyoniella australis]|nr:hypothetical protein [Candidatus Alcyoniella australis]